MGGGRKKRFSKNNSSSSGGGGAGGAAPGGLFVKGGVLSDWRNDFSSPSSTGGGSSFGKSKPGRVVGAKASSGPRKPSGITFDYKYQDVNVKSCVEWNSKDDGIDESCPTIVLDKETEIVAYVDCTPCSKTADVVSYSYDYGSSFVLGESSSHRGLGFADEPEVEQELTPGAPWSSSAKEEDGERLAYNSSFTDKDVLLEMSSREKEKVGEDSENEVMEDSPPEKSRNARRKKSDDEVFIMEDSPPERNSGFLSIGGMKLYTEDISDDEDDECTDADACLPNEGCSGSSDSCDSEGSSESDDSDDMFDSDSDIDDAVAEDYLEGIGGGEVVDVKWLLGQNLGTSEVENLGGTALQNASKEYGMKPPKKRSFVRSRRPGVTINEGSLGMDDFLPLKDPRTASGKKKKHVSQLPRSWPRESQSSKHFRSIPGAKKKHRKEMMIVKRRERMIRRGVDLDQINMKLKQMVLDEVDMLSFQAMDSRDCSQVQRLASIYRLVSGRQGSGKKRFVTVTRTEQTCMPSSADKFRLEKLLRAGEEPSDFVVNQVPKTKHMSAERSRTRKIAKLGNFSPPQTHQSAPGKLSRNSANRREASGKKRFEKEGGAYASQPMAFVSSGIMSVDSKVVTSIDSIANNTTSPETVANGVPSSSKFGEFELHTKGFGSKMMAKMGFVEGAGLGKDGQGIVQPVEAVKRPKSLGLGVQFSQNNESSRTDLSALETFEKLGLRTKSPGVRSSERRTASDKKERHRSKARTSESSGIGSFERHTKGFGSKMMAKMGFVEGTGLGRDSQGIVNPVAAVRLPKSRGLGATK